MLIQKVVMNLEAGEFFVLNWWIIAGEMKWS